MSGWSHHSNVTMRWTSTSDLSWWHDTIQFLVVVPFASPITIQCTITQMDWMLSPQSFDMFHDIRSFEVPARLRDWPAWLLTDHIQPSEAVANQRGQGMSLIVLATTTPRWAGTRHRSLLFGHYVMAVGIPALATFSAGPRHGISSIHTGHTMHTE